jgi:hypothetical protein
MSSYTRSHQRLIAYRKTKKQKEQKAESDYFTTSTKPAISFALLFHSSKSQKAADSRVTQSIVFDIIHIARHDWLLIVDVELLAATFSFFFLERHRHILQHKIDPLDFSKNSN